MNFGFSISTSNQLDYDTASTQLTNALFELEASAAVCFACGSCAATCSAGAFTAFNPRRVQALFRSGNTAGLKQELEKCWLCGKCSMVCPRGVNIRNVIKCANILLS